MKPILAAAMCVWVLSAGCLGEDRYVSAIADAKGDAGADAATRPSDTSAGLTCGADVAACAPAAGCPVGESCLGGACLVPATVAARAFDPLAPIGGAGGAPELLHCSSLPAPAPEAGAGGGDADAQAESAADDIKTAGDAVQPSADEGESFADAVEPPADTEGRLADTDAPHPAPSVTLFGAVDRLGAGQSTVGLRVQVLRAEDFARTVCRCDIHRAYYSAFRSCVDEQIAGLGEKWTTTAAPAASAAAALSFVDENPADCVLPAAKQPMTGGLAAEPDLNFTGPDDRKCRLGYVCEVDGAGIGHCVERFGVYTLESVPLDVELVVRVGPATAASGLWKDVYELGLVARSLPEARYRHSVVAMSTGQWTTLLNPWDRVMPEGVGVVAGRVVDCGSAGARGVDWSVQNATVALAHPPDRLVYLGDDATGLVPELNWSATGGGGRFVAVGVPPGPNRLAATVRVAQDLVALDAFDLYVVPEALVVANWPGRAPLSAR